MAIAARNELRFEYDTFGDVGAPPLLLVQGLGMPAAMWPDAFIETLVREGLRVLTFDNRDCGGSSRLATAAVPNIPRAMARALLRRPVTAPYTLDDMAEDAVAVLDAAGVARAHVAGVSMGGMIAQVIAARHPQRVFTLTSIMSSTGNPQPSVALGKTRALRALLRRPPRDPDARASRCSPAIPVRSDRQPGLPPGRCRAADAVRARGPSRALSGGDCATARGDPRVGRPA